jgi:hypothetical protein
MSYEDTDVSEDADIYISFTLNLEAVDSRKRLYPSEGLYR